ncbi:deacetylase, histone deacetylase/acetoin utilization protein [Xenococcus sp. PCC 7305]|uniref:histone deacetylase family protein n=1 Tax=Xenococcus sp. PCC 7305 TaxID=102125 RepID=UPI0002AC6B07|nr:histone deacetylase [Xenococcus sp. PCC 7305]ELS01222.1 deacetylase, histone deacetylase/acetoin utilization protein [Xenococcus sp. PCC 7305]
MLSVIYSEEFLQHKTGLSHPESPERLIAIVKALSEVPWQSQIRWCLPSPITKRDVLRYIRQVHTPEHIARIGEIASTGTKYLTPDTPVSQRSYEIALLAVNAWLDGVDLVWENQAAAFVLARPPGHHATKDQAMGFCLFSNAAIAANYALTKPGIERVAIVDWDVHHGNGTEDIVWDNPQLIYCSMHQHPCYPGTGASNDRGKHNNVLNLPMAPDSTIDDYRPVFESQLIPFLENFQPDLLIVSAGYDANHQDPLASISLQPPDYGFFTKCLTKITPKIVLGLEGGYHLQALADSVVATLSSLIP